MSRENNHINYTAGDIEQYLAGKLSPMQRHAMEKAALDDPFLAEAMEGYELVQGQDWNATLAALRDDIAGKGAVAKVIPLHKSNNNWKKAVAAILIIGAGATLTYTLTKNKAVETVNPQVAQHIPVVTTKDSLPQTGTQPSPSVTASLNPTASGTKDEVSANHGPVATLITQPKTGHADQYSTDPNAQQLRSTAPASKPVYVDEEKTIIAAAAPPAVNSSTPLQQGEVSRIEELADAKRKAAARQDNDLLYRQQAGITSNQPQGNMAKKEAVLNNFFTAQVLSTDNTPLPFTNISIRKDNFGTYTDAKGMVRLVSTDSILQVEVKSVGYQPRTFTLRNNQAQAKIILQEDEVALKDRTVVGGGRTTHQRSRRATLLTDSAVNVEPADGWDNYNTYVANNLDIPEDALKRELHGEVEISFDVRSNGTISNIRVNKSLGAEYDEAAKRLILEGPQWKVKKGRKTSAKVKVQF